MKPYYQDDYVTLFHGDCLEVTEWTTADVLVTDPPYGMSYVSNASKYNGPSEKIAADDTTQIRDDAIALWNPEKAAIVFGTWRVPKPNNVKQLVIWDKGDSPGMGDLSIPFGPSHEDIYILGKIGFTGKRQSSVIRVPTLSATDSRRPDHPTPKPIGLMEQLINKTTGIIADPFAGSGSTLVAARNLSRHVIGVELEEKYCELIAKRLSQQTFDLEGL